MPFDLSSEIDPSALAALAALGPRARVQEIVTVEWQGGANTKHYGNTAVEDVSGFEGVTSLGISAVEARFAKMQFLDVPRSASIADDAVSLSFWDGDNAISDLYQTSGEGTRVAVSQYLADVGLLVEVFWGLLKAPKEGGGEFFKIDAATGFRSINLPLPNRWIQPGCPNIFGGVRRPDGSLLFTLAEAQANRCPHDRNQGGTVGIAGFDSCPRDSTARCMERFGHTRFYGGFDIFLESEVVGSGGNRFVAQTRGNESLQKRPLRVVYGTRVVKDLDLLGYQAQSGGSHPERGYLKSLWLVCEGRVQDVYDFYVNDQYVAPYHTWIERGARGQSATDFTPNGLNYSGTAVVRADVGPKDWRGVRGGDLSAQCRVIGKNDIRVYTTPTAYTEAYTNNPAWCLLDLLTNKTYGHRLSHDQLVIQDWIDLAAWCNEDAYSVDETGTAATITRATFNADLTERTAQEQISDICKYHRFTLPFNFNGKTRILPLRAETPSPTFNDEGSNRNIIWENGKSTLTWSQKSDAEIPNQIKMTFDDASRNYAETTFPYDDFNQQMRAGMALGDNTVRVITKSHTAVGVTTFAEAARLARLLLDLGENEEGGLQNNVRIKFDTWSPLADALKLHLGKVIDVPSPKLERFREGPGIGFIPWRIVKMTRKANLRLTIEAQFHPLAYYAGVESADYATGFRGYSGRANPGGRTIGRPRPAIVRGDVNRTIDYVEFTVGEEE